MSSHVYVHAVINAICMLVSISHVPHTHSKQLWCVLISDHMSTQNPKQMSTHVPTHMSKHMPIRISTHMSEHMSIHTSTHAKHTGLQSPMHTSILISVPPSFHVRARMVYAQVLCHVQFIYVYASVFLRANP